MSLDLQWSLLDEDFTSHLRTILDNALQNASRPDFIGPIHLSTLHLGNEAPEVSIVDIGDVWQGFLDRGQSEVPKQLQRSKSQQQQHHHHHHQSRQGFNSLMTRTSSQKDRFQQQDHFARFAERNLPFTAEQGNIQNSSSRKNKASRLQIYRQYSDSGNAQLVDTGSVSSFDAATLSVPPTPASSHWGPGLLPADRQFSSHGSNASGYFPAWQGASSSMNQRSSNPLQRPQTWRRSSASVVEPNRLSSTRAPTVDGVEADVPSSSSSASSSLPSLQLHLSLHWNTSSIRVTVATSLLINHPSPAFMSLPLSITITGLVLQAGGLLAFEADQVSNIRRGHFCLVVEDEEEEEEEEERGEEQGKMQQEGVEPVQSSILDHRPSLRVKPAATPTNRTGLGFDQQITSGEKILSSVTLETSVGQADKHVLRNVAKVERFVVSLVRKAIGDELVFPNFYSVELP